MISLLKVAEKCIVVIGKKVDQQTVIDSCINAYAICVKKAFYEGKSEGDGAIDGAFIYPFKNLIPSLDNDYGLYYVDLPSSFIQLPHKMGINSVGYMKGEQFILTGSSSYQIDNTSLAGCLGGYQTYFQELDKIYFPKMTDVDVANPSCKILLKLTIAFDTVDPEENLNIPPNIVSDIVTMVAQLYLPKVNPVQKMQEDLN